jgi:hypothetical protein
MLPHLLHKDTARLYPFEQPPLSPREKPFKDVCEAHDAGFCPYGKCSALFFAKSFSDLLIIISSNITD